MITRFHAADYLDTEECQVAYIAAALESGDADFVRDALGLVARVRGMGGIAKKAGLNRESLYKALGETGNPEFGTVMRIVRALRPVAGGQASKRRRVARDMLGEHARTAQRRSAKSLALVALPIGSRIRLPHHSATANFPLAMFALEAGIAPVHCRCHYCDV